MQKRILVTGGCGFIGHHFVNHLLVNTDWDIIVLDSLTYASNGFDRLRDINCFDDRRVHRLSADFTQPITSGVSQEIGEVDYIVHMGAETHVDNSIKNPEPFVMSNVVGTFRMLEFARTLPNLKMMVYFSTDEVFGPAPGKTAYKEWDRYNSGNPYAATKAGGEELALAYANTYKLPVCITHTMNVFGERQDKEKFIPKVIKAVLKEDEVCIHADSTKTVSGSRFWIHARNVAQAITFLLAEALPGEKYNIVGEKEVSNLDIAKFIAVVLGKELNYKMVDFHSSRPGHDLRYALDGDKLKQMGFEYPKTFEQSLIKTIKWTLENPKWIGE
jgi:dTDP-glucose 4,6-dehydratase